MAERQSCATWQGSRRLLVTPVPALTSLTLAPGSQRLAIHAWNGPRRLRKGPRGLRQPQGATSGGPHGVPVSVGLWPPAPCPGARLPGGTAGGRTARTRPPWPARCGKTSVGGWRPPSSWLCLQGALARRRARRRRRRRRRSRAGRASRAPWPRCQPSR